MQTKWNTKTKTKLDRYCAWAESRLVRVQFAQLGTMLEELCSSQLTGMRQSVMHAWHRQIMRAAVSTFGGSSGSYDAAAWSSAGAARAAAVLAPATVVCHCFEGEGLLVFNREPPCSSLLNSLAWCAPNENRPAKPCNAESESTIHFDSVFQLFNPAASVATRMSLPYFAATWHWSPWGDGASESASVRCPHRT
jgi:hypothetical protein